MKQPQRYLTAHQMLQAKLALLSPKSKKQPAALAAAFKKELQTWQILSNQLQVPSLPSLDESTFSSIQLTDCACEGVLLERLHLGSVPEHVSCKGEIQSLLASHLKRPERDAGHLKWDRLAVRMSIGGQVYGPSDLNC